MAQSWPYDCGLGAPRSVASPVVGKASRRKGSLSRRYRLGGSHPGQSELRTAVDGAKVLTADGDS